MVVLRLVVVALAAALMPGCYGPKVRDCAVTCMGSMECPEGTACLGGLCRTGDGEMACPAEADGGGELPPVPWTMVEIGGGHACGVDPDGGLWCWGDGRLGQTGQATLGRSPVALRVALDDVIDVAVGRSHSCAIVDGDGDGDGTLSCFGANRAGELGRDTDGLDGSAEPLAVDGDADDWIQVVAGDAFTCALRAGGALSCFGTNYYGQAGQPGDLVAIVEPTAVAPGEVWSTVACGESHACAVRDDGTLWCWGYNLNEGGGPGILGTVSDDVAQPSPGQVGDAADWTGLALGFDHSCGLRGDGALWCWGQSDHGEAGQPLGLIADPVQLNEDRYGSVSAGFGHTCAVTSEGVLLCWGLGSDGQLGDGEFEDHVEPVDVEPAAGWQSVEAGSTATCGRRQDGLVSCWGDTRHGQLGDGQLGMRLEPVRVGGASDWTEVFAGHMATCARSESGVVACFGDNRYGQIGIGSETDFVTAPAAIALAEVTTVSLGNDMACAVAGGQPYCWGYEDGGGRLGLGNLSQAEVHSPGAVVDAGGGWTAVSAGSRTSCGIKAGAVYCWGIGDAYQLGNGATTPAASASPVLASLLTETYDAIVLGLGGGCALDRAASAGLDCWGSDDDGLRGDGPTAALPESSNHIAGPASSSAGYVHLCAVQLDQTLRCWGDGSYGKLGTGDEVLQPAPVQVGSATDWIAVAAGANQTCGLRGSAGAASAYCWGADFEGTLGDGDGELPAGTVVAVAGEHLFGSLALGYHHACAVDSDGALWCWGRGVEGQLGLGVSLQGTPAGLGRPE